MSQPTPVCGRQAGPAKAAASCRTPKRAPPARFGVVTQTPLGRGERRPAFFAGAELLRIRRRKCCGLRPVARRLWACLPPCLATNPVTRGQFNTLLCIGASKGKRATPDAGVALTCLSALAYKQRHLHILSLTGQQVNPLFYIKPFVSWQPNYIPLPSIPLDIIHACTVLEFRLRKCLTKPVALA